jgi:exonuclease VII small subunit
MELSKNLSFIGESVERLVSEMEKARQGVHHANQIGKDGVTQAGQATAEIQKAEQTLQIAYRHAADLNALFQVYLQATPGQDHLQKRMDEFMVVLHSALQSVHSLNIHQTTLASNSQRISESIHGINVVFDGSYQMLQTLHISTHGAARDMQESSKALVRIAATAEQSRESALDSAKEIAVIHSKADELKMLSEDLGQLARKFAI